MKLDEWNLQFIWSLNFLWHHNRQNRILGVFLGDGGGVFSDIWKFIARVPRDWYKNGCVFDLCGFVCVFLIFFFFPLSISFPYCLLSTMFLESIVQDNRGWIWKMFYKFSWENVYWSGFLIVLFRKSRQKIWLRSVWLL